MEQYPQCGDIICDTFGPLATALKEVGQSQVYQDGL